MMYKISVGPLALEHIPNFLEKCEGGCDKFYYLLCNKNLSENIYTKVQKSYKASKVWQMATGDALCKIHQSYAKIWISQPKKRK